MKKIISLMFLPVIIIFGAMQDSVSVGADSSSNLLIDNSTSIEQSDTVMMDKMTDTGNLIQTESEAIKIDNKKAKDSEIVDTQEEIRSESVQLQPEVESNSIGSEKNYLSEDEYFKFIQMLDTTESIPLGGIMGKLGKLGRLGKLGKLAGEDISPYKLEKYQAYLDIYYPEAHSDAVQSFVINIYVDQSAWPKMFSESLKLLYFYPESSLRNSVKQTCLEYISKKKYFKDENNKFIQALDNADSFGNESENYYSYLNSLSNFTEKDISNLYAVESNIFLQSYADSPFASDVLLGLASYYEKNEMYNRAYNEYSSIIVMYPNSNDVIKALYNRGIIESASFNLYDEAITTFRKFLVKFPDDNLASKSQLAIAEIFDTHLENWNQAITEYKNYAQNYPGTKTAFNSLMRVGKIQAKELKEPDKAIETYHYTINLFYDLPQAIQGYIRSGDIYEGNKKYQPAIDEYYSAYKFDPKSDQALEMLEKCVVISEKRLKNNAKTKEFLNIIVKDFPDTKSAKSAYKKLSKL